MTPELIVSLIIGLFGGGGLVNFFRLRSSERQASADVASTIVGAAGEIVGLYREESEELEIKVDDLERHAKRTEMRLRAVEAERDALASKVRDLERKVRILEGLQHRP